jgi:hypothetical protein
MARLPGSGVSFVALYERTPATDEYLKAGIDPSKCPTTTLAEVIAELGLAPLSAEDEAKIRSQLGMAIGLGLLQFAGSPKNREGRLSVVAVRQSLKRILKGLDALAAGHQLDPVELQEIEQLIAGTNDGFRRGHDIAVALSLRAVLAQELGDVQGAKPPPPAPQPCPTELDDDPALKSDYDPDRIKAPAKVHVGNARAAQRLNDFSRWPRTISEAARRAITKLEAIKGKGGRPSADWYGDFVEVLMFIAGRNQRAGQAPPSLVDLAEKLQQLFPPHMRSSREAIAKRLNRLGKK